MSVREICKNTFGYTSACIRSYNKEFYKNELIQKYDTNKGGLLTYVLDEEKEIL